MDVCKTCGIVAGTHACNAKDVSIFSMQKLIKSQNDELQALRERVKKLEKANKLLEADAKRYRWLSEQNADLELDSFVVLSHDGTVEEGWQKYWSGSDLNKAIDEAMENNNDVSRME